MKKTKEGFKVVGVYGLVFTFGFCMIACSLLKIDTYVLSSKTYAIYCFKAVLTHLFAIGVLSGVYAFFSKKFKAVNQAVVVFGISVIVLSLINMSYGRNQFILLTSTAFIVYAYVLLIRPFFE